MKLDEAKQVLQNNGYIVEKLSPKYTDLEFLFQKTLYDYGVKPKYIDAFESQDGGAEDYGIYISNRRTSQGNDEFMIQSCALYTVECAVINISDEELQNLLHLNSYHLRSVGYVDPRTGFTTYTVEKINTDTIYPNEGEKFCHLSEAEPDKILKTGLRCRESNHKNTKWKKDINWYGGRIYLTKITPKTDMYLQKEEDAAFQRLDSEDEDEHIDEESAVTLYRYTITLPKTFPLHQDPEYGKGRFYTTQNIPPQFIKYERGYTMIR